MQRQQPHHRQWHHTSSDCLDNFDNNFNFNNNISCKLHQQELFQQTSKHSPRTVGFIINMNQLLSPASSFKLKFKFQCHKPHERETPISLSQSIPCSPLTRHHWFYRVCGAFSTAPGWLESLPSFGIHSKAWICTSTTLK